MDRPARTAGNIAIVIVLGATLFAPFSARSAPTAPDASAPKIVNFYLPWTLSDSDARELSKWDLVVLDMEVQERDPEAIRLMRQLHPGIRILAYVTASELRSDAAAIGAAAPLRQALASGVSGSWYLTDAQGAKRSFWSGTWILNVTDGCPLSGGERWSEYLPRFVHDRILSSGLWDGVMYDNGWENISFFAGGAVDLDRDGKAESAAAADAAWRAGLARIFERTRELSPDAIVMENDGPYYASAVNGLQIENFPNGGWTGVMAKAAKAEASLLPPGLLALNANTGNTGQSADYSRFRYGLASALLLDAYYGFDFGDMNHGQLWWYDEYDASLGEPSGPAKAVGGGGAWKAGVWRRDYARGTVLMNSGSAAKKVSLGGDFERLHGTQDPATNDGSVVGSLTLAAGDGIVLLKPLGDIRGAMVPNGAYARIFSPDGAIKRTGFFVSADRYPATADLLTRVAGGVNREIAIADGGRVRTYDSAYRPIGDFRPFGDGFKGDLSIAFLDPGKAGEVELAVTGTDSGGGEVKVFDLAGRLKADFRAFGADYAGGVNLAAGDTDGDGDPDIVVGAGAGGGPHVRIFSRRGALDSGGFFAYALKFHGGVRVAAADLDGDGRAEIVTGAGAGGGPHVRIFRADGTLESEFFAYDRGMTAGIWVGAADVDGDGKAEVVAFTRDTGALAGSAPMMRTYAYAR